MKKRSIKPAGPKAVAYELIRDHTEIGRPMYERLCTILDAHHDELSRTNVRIALGWAKNWKADTDGRITLGKCKKASDLDRELAPYDFIILLNKDFWQNARVSDLQRTALLDHELCHCGIVYDERGDAKIDERGRTVYRVVKHTIEEFTDVIDRHGTYKSDLEEFARALRRSDAQTASTWVGYESLRERLAAAGVTVALDNITQWSELERKQADKWARLELEIEEGGVAVEGEYPPHVLAAAANLSADDDPRGESWRVIAEYPDYEVSSRGRVRRMTSRTSGQAGHVLRSPLRGGYPCVDLCRDGRKKTHHVHRLVAGAFLDRVPGAPEVNHIDGVRTNNDFENLEWVTRQDNQLHAYRAGLQDAGHENNGFAKLTEVDVVRIRGLAAAADRPSYQAIADIFHVTESNIRAVVQRRTWTYAELALDPIAVHETLLAVGLDIPATVIATWPDDERREVHTWALLRQEMGEKVSASTSQTLPACVAAALQIPTPAAGADTH